METGITYCKFKGERAFKAFDINEGYAVDKIIYATIIDVTPENCRKLQDLADLNKENGLKIQLRQGTKVLFETK